jgi:hypothetical protein
MDSKPSFKEHYVPREQKVYARDYHGVGPAFVLMHGFPDITGDRSGSVPAILDKRKRLSTTGLRSF